MKNILVTGFDPFGGERVNPASRAVSRLTGMETNGYQIVTREIPTVFGKSGQVVQQAIQDLNPSVVILSLIHI